MTGPVTVEALQRLEWEIGLEMTTDRKHCAAVSLNGSQLVVLGGERGITGTTRREQGIPRAKLNTVEKFDGQDFVSDDETMLQERTGFAAASKYAYIYAVGGDTSTSAKSVEVRGAEGGWTEFVEMKRKRHGCAAVIVGYKLYIFGGYDKDAKATLDSCECYDLFTRQPQDMASMSTGREYCTASAIGNKIYVFGGKDGNNTHLNTMEIYDIGENHWTNGCPMPTRRSRCASVAFQNFIMVIGGRSENEGEYFDTVHLYDTECQEWVGGSLQPMSQGRSGCTAAIAIVNNRKKLFVVDGNDGNHALNTTELLDLGVAAEENNT